MEFNQAIDIVKDAGFGYLATMDKDQPCIRPMMPYLTESNELLLALLKRSRTIEQIRNNPKVEFCFVDRKMSYCRVAGIGSILEDLEKKVLVFNGIAMLRQYFTHPEDPNFVLVSIKIKRLEAMTPYDKGPTEIVIL